MGVNLRAHHWSLLEELRFAPVDRRIRCTLGGAPVCDTTDAMVVWEPRRVVPTYAVPEADLAGTLTPAEGLPVPDPLPPVLGPAGFGMHLAPGRSFDVGAGGRTAVRAAFRPEDPDLGGRVVLEWSPFDWVEEAHPVLGHPHDPFKRIDVLPSDRHVVVSFDGTVLAESGRAVALYETLLPVRWYLPREDVRMDLLTPSESRTTCAYKGHASYFSVASGGPAGKDLAWTYVDPLHEVAGVKGLVCFWSERTDLTIDGESLARPVTPWSRPDEQQKLLEQAEAAESLELG